MGSREAFPGPPHLSLEPLILLLQVPTGLDSDVSSDEAQRWEGTQQASEGTMRGSQSQPRAFLHGPP